jgi:hypothetical protein
MNKGRILKKVMEFSKLGLTPGSQATFSQRYGEKREEKKRLKMIYSS